MASPVTQPSPQDLSQDTSGQLVAIAIIFTVVDVFIATLRFLSMRIKERSFELHDLFSYIGLIFILGECIMGFGKFIARNSFAYCIVLSSFVY